VYRAVLADPGSAGHVAAALAGLDEDHDACLPGAAVPFLAHASPRVRDPVVTGELLVPLLRDPSAKVTAAALRYLRGQPLPASVLADLDAAGSPRSRRIALSIRQRSGSWERVCADLAAMAGADPDLAEAARADLLPVLLLFRPGRQPTELPGDVLLPKTDPRVVTVMAAPTWRFNSPYAC
jgi:hypothetical protein